jgi:glycosyltransferase involved in cell wall biosynthesis
MHAVAQRYGLPERFILHVSNYTDPRKNVLRLAAAADQLGLPLVIAGHSMPGPVANELAAYARRNDRMRVLGFVDRGTRDALYALCHVFCLPSHHEGTGLAALEAGAAGAHVVITRLGGTRDYFKDLALYVSPTNDHEIRSMLAKAWDTPRDTKLKNHIRANLSWDTSACALEQAYETARARKAKA